LLAPEPIPLFVFKEAREQFGEPLVSALANEGLDEALAALRVFALVEREQIADERDPAITTDAIRLHRLVREVAALRADGAQKDAVRHTLVAMLAAVYPDDGFNNPASWPLCATLTPHLVATCETETADAAESAQRAVLLNRAGSYFHGRAGDPAMSAQEGQSGRAGEIVEGPSLTRSRRAMPARLSAELWGARRLREGRRAARYFTARVIAVSTGDQLRQEALGVGREKPVRIPRYHGPSPNRRSAMHQGHEMHFICPRLHVRGNYRNPVPFLGERD